MCRQKKILEIFILYVNVLPAYLSVQYVYAWSEEGAGSLKQKLPNVVSYHVMLGTEPKSSAGAASETTEPSLQPFI